MTQPKQFTPGIDLIRDGMCPMSFTAPMACWFCAFGHATECHYPLRCADAECSHYKHQLAGRRAAATRHNRRCAMMCETKKPYEAPQAIIVDTSSTQQGAERAAQDRGGSCPNDPQPEPRSSGDKQLVLDLNPYEFKAWGKTPERCRVRAWMRKPREDRARDYVALITQLPGEQIVTNLMPQIATEVLPMIVRNPEDRLRVAWVEHWPRPSGDTFDLVLFMAFAPQAPIVNRWGLGFAGPYWHRISRETFFNMIGEEVQL